MTDTSHLATAGGSSTPLGVGAAPRVGFGRTLRSEWTKLWSLQATRRCFFASLLIALGTAFLLCFTIGPTTGIPLEQREPMDILSTSLLGTDAAALMLMLTAAGTVGSEFSTGMMRTTLTVTPRRVRFLFAKAAAVFLAAEALGLAAALISVAAGQTVVAALGLNSLPMDLESLHLAAGAAQIAPFYAVLAVAFSLVFRNTAGGVTASIVVLFLPTFVSWLPDWWQANVLPFLPGEAIHILAGLTGPGSVSYTNPLVAALTLVAWLLAALGVAAVALKRHDV